MEKQRQFRTAIVLLVVVITATTSSTIVLAEESEQTAEDKATKRYYHRQRVSLAGPYNPTAAISLSLYPGLVGVGIGIGLVAGGSHIDSKGMIYSGAALFGIALALGPSLGHFYANNVRRGVITLLIRAALLTISFTTLIAWPSESGECEESDEDGPCYDTESADPDLWLRGTLLIAPIIGALVIGTIDVVAAPRAALRANASYNRRNRAWRLTPTVVVAQHVGIVPGLVFSASF